MLALSISGCISRNCQCGISVCPASCSRIRCSKPEAGARPLALACMPMVPPVYSTMMLRAGCAVAMGCLRDRLIVSCSQYVMLSTICHRHKKRARGVIPGPSKGERCLVPRPGERCYSIGYAFSGTRRGAIMFSGRRMSLSISSSSRPSSRTSSSTPRPLSRAMAAIRVAFS
ncbi:hypothetical protein D9M71_668610 [compost metagenome]